MDHQANTLAFLCAAGGMIGYYRRGSVPSLIGGIGCGILYGVAGYLIRQNAEYGIQTAMAASAILVGGSAGRAIRTKQPVPVTLALLGLGSFGYYGYKYYEFYF